MFIHFATHQQYQAFVRHLLEAERRRISRLLLCTAFAVQPWHGIILGRHHLLGQARDSGHTVMTSETVTVTGIEKETRIDTGHLGGMKTMMTVIDGESETEIEIEIADIPHLLVGLGVVKGEATVIETGIETEKRTGMDIKKGIEEVKERVTGEGKHGLEKGIKARLVAHRASVRYLLVQLPDLQGRSLVQIRQLHNLLNLQVLL